MTNGIAAVRQVVADGLPGGDAERLLQAWGALKRSEADREVGLPDVCPSCQGYESPPEWGPDASAPKVHISQQDMDRTLWCMVILCKTNHRLWRDARDHYRDGARLGWQRREQIRSAFTAKWQEWSVVDGPTNSI